jgi:LAO/AO transport system kinase
MQVSIDALRAGDIRALSRAISAVENRAAGSSELLKALFPHTGRARVIGLTGPPGAGKSTLVDQLARVYRKTKNPHSNRKEPGLNGAADENYTVGIIAVDPTSQYTGGAILGDRIRMQEHFADPGIYIRSMATRGSLGGLARTTADVTTVLDASGRDVILIETVGVGQDEVDIVRLADCVVVVMVPGLGDDIQNMKAGLMEVADIFVLNKSEREGADRLEQELHAMLSLVMPRDGWHPPVVRTVASENKGIDTLAVTIAKFRAHFESSGERRRKHVEHWKARLIELAESRLMQKVLGGADADARLTALAGEVADRKKDPFAAVTEILQRGAASL